MIFLVKILFIDRLRQDYSRWALILYHLIVNFISLIVYYFTSEALANSFASQWYNLDYFSFLVLGELAMILPNSCMEMGVDTVHSLYAQKYLNQVLLSKKGLHYYLTLNTLSSLGIDIIQFFTIVCFGLFLGLKVSFGSLLIMLLVQILAIPIFLAVGQFAAYFYLSVGRGKGVINQIIFMLNVLSGALFPISVFPSNISQIVALVSPFHATLDATRKAASSTSSALDQSLLIIFFVGLLALLLSYYISRLVLRRTKMRGLLHMKSNLGN